MQNINEKNNLDKKSVPTPLGLEEMNSVIKSFQDSSFNMEELYKKNEKGFVKKTLYDLAIESEKKPSNQSSANEDKEIISENLTKNADNQTINKDLDDQKISSELQPEIKEEKDSSEFNQKETNNEEKIVQDENNEDLNRSLTEKKDTNHLNESEELSKNNTSENKETQTVLEDSDDNSQSKDKKTDDKNFEDNTLEALDSVRDAVSKSLDKNNEENEEKTPEELDSKTENLEGQSKIIEKIKDDYSEIENLFNKIKNETINEIENLIKEKVIRISSEVAGYQIEKLPQKFLDKIKSELVELTSSKEEVIIYLNKEDLNSVNKIKEKTDFEKKIKFQENETLNRGDFLIKAGGLDHLITYTSDQK